MPLNSLHRIVWTSLLAALIAVGGFVHAPLGPVPVSLQTLFVYLAGFALGPLQGALAVAVYLAAGIAGLPVFVGGGSGLAYLFGPTGGYLAGFVACAALCGLGGRSREGREAGLLRLLGWGVLGTAALYGLGVLRLMGALDINLGKALAVGAAPFVPGDLVKLFLAALASRSLARRRLLPS